MNMGTIIAFKGGYLAWAHWRKVYGECFCFFLGHRPAVMISDPALAQQVLATKTSVFKDRGENPLPSLAIGQDKVFERAGVVFAKGPFWKGLRATWTHYLMHSQALQVHYFSIINEAVDALMTTLRRLDGQVLDFSTVCSSLTMDVIGTVGFGVQLSTPGQMETHSPVLVAASPFFNASSVLRNPYLMLYSMVPAFGWPLRLLAKYLPLGSQKELNDGRKYIYDMVVKWMNVVKEEEARAKRTAKESESDGKAAAAEAKMKATVPQPGSFLRVMMNAVSFSSSKGFTGSSLSPHLNHSFRLRRYGLVIATRHHQS